MKAKHLGWLASLAGCVASSQADPAPAASGARPAVAAAVAPEPASAVAVDPDPEPTPDAPRADVPPAPTELTFEGGRRIVGDGVQPGLVEFAAALESNGALWIGTLPGNGDRDVAIYVPPDPDPAARFRLVYHFHGTYSEHIEAKRPGLDKKKWVGWNRLAQTIEAADELQADGGDNVVLVYPISAGKRKEPDYDGWFNGAYDRMWMRHEPPDHRDSFERLHRDVVGVLDETLGIPKSRLRRRVTAEGHSAGGIALRNVAMSGTKRVREYIFQDAAFQTWADGCFAGVEASGADSLITLVITSGGIGDPLAGRDPWCVDLQADAARWPSVRARCDRDPKAKIDGIPCETLRARVEEDWPEVERWCHDLQNDMADVPNVYVHRTKIRHGDQPRHFTGGLELPAKRFGSRG